MSRVNPLRKGNLEDQAFWVDVIFPRYLWIFLVALAGNFLGVAFAHFRSRGLRWDAAAFLIVALTLVLVALYGVWQGRKERARIRRLREIHPS